MDRARQFVRHHREVIACVIATTLIACVALARMGLLSPASTQDVLVFDSARTAYVAKNLVEGRGYTTDDLPASMVAYYDREGILHEAHWRNGDRFPFAAFAIAGLYLVTGSHDAWTGVVVYNLVTFVLFLTALFVLARRLTGSALGGAVAVALALLHSQTYVFLFMKDADMLWLAVLTLSCFHGYLRRDAASRTAGQLAWFGTVLAWSFLSRPNVALPFMLALALASLIGLARGLRGRADGTSLRRWMRTDLIALAVAAAWIAPFIAYNLHAWGEPLFSANRLYQPPLGTGLGMGTDTWWRYFPADHDYSLGHLWSVDRAAILGKFTSSWFATLRTFVGNYVLDLGLALAAVHVVRRRRAQHGPDPALAGLRGAAWAMGAAFAFNFVTLPLYSYQDYSWRHYLSFALPLVWIAATIAVLAAGRALTPAWQQVQAWVRPRRGAIGLVVGAAACLALLRSPGNDGNLLVMAAGRWAFKHWLIATLLLVIVAAWPWWRRWSRPATAVVVATVALMALYRPHKGWKSFTHIHVPMSNRVWAELRERDGLVTSLALQTQVSWNTGRKNIPAPEWPLRIYELTRRHALWFEDIYLESPEAALTPFDGLFGRAAPGFEGYLRLARYRDHLPGYRLAFHEEGKVGRPRWRVPARAKSSTVYTLVDRAAVEAMWRTPTAIEIGAEAAAPYAAHGFGGYYQIDGKPVIAATDATRSRYTPTSDRPFEDTSVTFFVDDQVPRRVTVELYAPQHNQLAVYWNLDLDAYTPASGRAAHHLGTVEIVPGWQTLTLDVPADLPRRGLNKLGFRAARLPDVALCGAATPDALCARLGAPTALYRFATTERDTATGLSVFLHRLTFEATP